MIIYHLVALAIALLLDKIIGDPVHWPHPVRWMGSFIGLLEKKMNRGKLKRWKGIGMLFLVLFVFTVSTFSIVFFSYKVHIIFGVFIEGVVIATTISQKSLKKAAFDVYDPLISGNIKEARKYLSYIVGRDTERLNEPEIIRGTVETVAENTCDGITAPLFWGFIGGAPLAIAYRVINTCDSMVGYKSERYELFGWASAKLDDVVNWLPSRLSGVIALQTMKPKQTTRHRAVHVLFRDAKKHVSPNSGWGEAATAALLGIQLGGSNTYKKVTSHREKTGDALVPLQALHLKQAVLIMERTTILFFLYLCLFGWLINIVFK